MRAYFQCLSPPIVSTLLIMYTHESITGPLRFVLSPHSAAFIQRFFGNNFPRRTRAADVPRACTCRYNSVTCAMYTKLFLPSFNSNKYSRNGSVRFCAKPYTAIPRALASECENDSVVRVYTAVHSVNRIRRFQFSLQTQSRESVNIL